MTEIKKGEAVVFLEDYNLFDTNLRDQEGMFYKYSTIDGKCLVYVPSVEEWAEPILDSIKQKKPGHVPRKYANLCKRIRELQITA
mgnify:FL=1